MRSEDEFLVVQQDVDPFDDDGDEERRVGGEEVEVEYAFLVDGAILRKAMRKQSETNGAKTTSENRESLTTARRILVAATTAKAEGDDVIDRKEEEEEEGSMQSETNLS